MLPEEDAVVHLRSKVQNPKREEKSACIDISDSKFWNNGRCNVDEVILSLNNTGMWMVQQTWRHIRQQKYEDMVTDALEWLYNIPDAVEPSVHDMLVERIDRLQDFSQPSLIFEDDVQLPVQTVQWGDADDAVQKLSRRSWMMTERGKQHLRTRPHVAPRCCPTTCCTLAVQPRLATYGLTRPACHHRGRTVRLLRRGPQRKCCSRAIAKPPRISQALPPRNVPKNGQLT